MKNETIKLEDFTTPRVIIVSDGEGHNWEKPLERAKENKIIIDCIALLSSKSGEKTLKNLAQSTSGEFILPTDLDHFLQKLEWLANKKDAKKQEDTILCLDSSGSMSATYRKSEKKKIDGLKDAVDKFLIFKNKADSRDRVGVVAFGTSGGDNVKKLIDLSINKDSINAAVRKLTPSDGTPLGAGLNLALNILDWENRSNQFKFFEARPIDNSDLIPSGTKCVYCEKKGGSNLLITKDTFDSFSGKYNFGAWQCPECQAYFHGGCFTKNDFTNGKCGLCYNCLIPLKIPENLDINKSSSIEMNVGITKKFGESPSSMEVWTEEALEQERVKRQMESSKLPEWEGFEDLSECPKCGYALRSGWSKCPICNEPVK